MKKDILEKIHSILGTTLIQTGFKANKALEQYKYNNKEYRTDLIFEIKNKGHNYLQHIKFEFTSKKLDKVFKVFDNKLREQKGVMTLNFSRPSLLITDWKTIIKKHDVDLTKFWFKHYDNIDEIGEDSNKYLSLADLTIELSEKLQNTEILKEYLLDNYSVYHLQMYLCIVYMKNENLEKAFETVTSLTKDYIDIYKKELKDFYNLLK